MKPQGFGGFGGGITHQRDQDDPGLFAGSKIQGTRHPVEVFTFHRRNGLGTVIHAQCLVGRSGQIDLEFHLIVIRCPTLQGGYGADGNDRQVIIANRNAARRRHCIQVCVFRIAQYHPEVLVCLCSAIAQHGNANFPERHARRKRQGAASGLIIAVGGGTAILCGVVNRNRLTGQAGEGHRQNCIAGGGITLNDPGIRDRQNSQIIIQNRAGSATACRIQGDTLWIQKLDGKGFVAL